MPVLITGAHTSEGRATARRLLRTGGEVRVFLPPFETQAADELRNLGCKVARGTLDDEGHLETALEQVHTVIHLAGNPMTAPAAVLDDAASVLSAAISAECRRIIWASHLGAGSPSGNPYLEACAETEQLLADAPLEAIVIRRSLTYGPDDELTEALAEGSLPPQALESTHSPLYVDDLALVIEEADRVRGHLADLFVLLTLSGPTEVLLGAFADFLTSPERDPAHVAVLPPPVVDLLTRDLVSDEGITGPTRIPEGLERLSSD